MEVPHYFITNCQPVSAIDISICYVCADAEYEINSNILIVTWCIQDVNMKQKCYNQLQNSR